MLSERERKRRHGRGPELPPALQETGTSAKKSPLERAGLPILLTALALVFSPALSGPFVLDDRLLVLENPRLDEPLVFFREPVRAHLPGGRPNSYYRPLSFLSLWLDFQLWGARPFGFHLTSLLLHLASTALLFRILRRLPGADNRLALAVAAFWSLLPIHAETVSYIAARHDVLFLALYLLALDVYTGGRGIARGLLFTALSVAAFLAKEMAVSLPVAALLYDVLAKRERGERQLGPQLLWPAVSLLLLFWLRVWATPDNGTVLSFDPVFMASVAWHYLTMLAEPLAYSIDRSRDLVPSPAKALAFASVLGAGAAALVPAATRRSRAKRRLAAFGVLWSAVAYAPVSGIVALYTSCADRYLYLPTAGLVLCVAALLPEQSTRRARWTARPALAALCLLTFLRCGFFTGERTLYAETLATSPESPLAHNNFALVLRREGEVARAAAHFARALETEPTYTQARFNLGVLARECGDTRTCERLLEGFVESAPEDPQGWYQWALCALAAGDFEKAVQRLERADRLRPRDLGIRYHLAAAHFRGGDLERAGRILAELRERHPGHERTCRLLEAVDRASGGKSARKDRHEKDGHKARTEEEVSPSTGFSRPSGVPK